MVVEPDLWVWVHVAAQDPNRGLGTCGGLGAHRIGDYGPASSDR
jgi:hypothetical protein